MGYQISNLSKVTKVYQDTRGSEIRNERSILDIMKNGGAGGI